MDNVTNDNDDGAPDETAMAASKQPALFPEDGAGDFSAVAQQLMAMPPDQMAVMASGLDPDIRSNLAQALFSAMTPEEKSAVDTSPAADIQANMAGAVAERPEQQYQMSVARAQKAASLQPGLGALADDHLGKWSERVESLHEDGYLSEDRYKSLTSAFDKKSENRFSILLDNKGFLHDSCVAVEALEDARAGQASLSKSVLANAGRFSSAKPPAAPKNREGSDQFDREAAEAAGSRLARMS